MYGTAGGFVGGGVWVVREGWGMGSEGERGAMGVQRGESFWLYEQGAVVPVLTRRLDVPY